MENESNTLYLVLNTLITNINNLDTNIRKIIEHNLTSKSSASIEINNIMRELDIIKHDTKRVKEIVYKLEQTTTTKFEKNLDELVNLAESMRVYLDNQKLVYNNLNYFKKTLGEVSKDLTDFTKDYKDLINDINVLDKNFNFSETAIDIKNAVKIINDSHNWLTLKRKIVIGIIGLFVLLYTSSGFLKEVIELITKYIK